MGLRNRLGRMDLRKGWPLLAVVAFGVRLVPTLGPGLTGSPNYDPSVYYTAAVGFFCGRLPYRDFLLLHPPGVVLLLQPFAALGAWIGDPLALAATRVAFMAGGAIATALVYLLLRRQGRLAGVIGAGVYAVSPALAHVERAPWLEAPASLLLLVALVVLRPGSSASPTLQAWRPGVAGLLLSLAALTKLWGVALLVTVLVWLLVTRGLRSALVGVLGAAIGAVIVLAPFVAALPQLWDDVVLAQVQRPAVRTEAWARIADILAPGIAANTPVVTALIILIAVVVLAAAVVAVRTPAGRLYVALLAVAVGVLLASPAWYPNYPAFAGAPLALVLGSAVGALTDRLPRLGRRLVAAAASVLILAGATSQLLSRDGFTFPSSQLAASLSGRPGCVTIDHPIALILTDRLRTDLRNGCPLVADLSGYIHVVDGSPQRRDNPAFQKLMMDYLGGGETTVIMSGMWPGDFNQVNRDRVESWPVVGSAGTIVVRQPVP